MSLAAVAPVSVFEQFDADCWSGNIPAPQHYTVEIPSSLISRFSNFFNDNPPPEDADLAAYVHDMGTHEQFTQQVRSVLFRFCGFVVTSAVPEEWLQDRRARAYYAWLCTHVGRLNYKLGPFYEVYDRGPETYTLTTRYSDTHFSHGFHTDGTGRAGMPDVVGLMCIRQAVNGGENHLSNVMDVHQRLFNTEHRALVELYKPIMRDCVVPENADPQEVLHAHTYPVFQWGEQGRGFTFRYMRRWIEVAYRRLNETVPEELAAALDTLDKELIDPANTLTLKLKKGEALLFNNLRLAHDRSAFSTDPVGNRLMLRAWLDVNFK